MFWRIICLVLIGLAIRVDLDPSSTAASPSQQSQAAVKAQDAIPDFDLRSADIPGDVPAGTPSVQKSDIPVPEKKTDSNYRLQKVKEWRSAVLRHTAGVPDRAAREIANWQPSDLDMLVDFLTKSGKSTFRKATIRRLLQLTDEEARKGDLTRLLKQGALLHTDIDLLELEAGIYQQTHDGIYATGIFADGRVFWVPQRFHWGLARRLLDPLPVQDSMLKQWYIATTAHMQSRRLLGYAGQNLKSALQKFPSDEKILFYAGALHEIWALPVNQNPMLPPGGKISYGSMASELATAKEFYRKALAANAGFSEAHLRHGRVLGLLGHHKDAVEELQRAAAGIQDQQLLYYSSLFLGRELTMLSRQKEARDQYERAAALFPTAQSPLLALSQLAHSSGDSKGALVAVEKVFSLSLKDRWKDDPWWEYDLAHVRNADSLISEMHKSFGGLPR